MKAQIKKHGLENFDTLVSWMGANEGGDFSPYKSSMNPSLLPANSWCCARSDRRRTARCSDGIIHIIWTATWRSTIVPWRRGRRPMMYRSLIYTALSVKKYRSTLRTVSIICQDPPRQSGSIFSGNWAKSHSVLHVSSRPVSCWYGAGFLHFSQQSRNINRLKNK